MSSANVGGDAQSRGWQATGQDPRAGATSARKSEHPVSPPVSDQALRDFLIDYFDKDELNSLCFDLEIDPGEVRGETRSTKAMELVLYCKRRGRSEDLKAACARLRPEQWSTTFAGRNAGPVQPPTEGGQNDSRVAERESVRTMLEETKRRYYHLKKQEASYGISTPAHIALEIQDLEGKKDYKGNIYQEGEIAKLERQLKELGG
jgi:hypothetical protein